MWGRAEQWALRFAGARKAPAAPRRPAQPTSAEGLGQDQEAFRIKCETSRSELLAVSANIQDMFATAIEMSAHLKQKIVDYEEASRVNEALGQQALVLGRELETVQRENLQLTQKVSTLDRQRQDNEQVLEKLSSRVEELDGALRIKSAEAVALSCELQDTRTKLLASSREAQETQERLQQLRAEFAQVDSERQNLNDRLLAETAERLRVAKIKDEFEENYVNARKALAEAATKEHDLCGQIATLTLERDRAALEAGQFRASLYEAEARRETESSGFAATIEAVRQRVDFTERLLAQAREEARGLQHVKKLSDDAKDRLASMKETLERVTRERDEHRLLAQETSAENTVLERRIEELTYGLKEEAYRTAQARAEVESLQTQLEQSRLDSQVSLKRAKEKESSLLEALIKDRMERAYAEGALETARKDRLQLQRALEEFRQNATQSIPHVASEELSEAEVLKSARS